jgi:hypothetical protein
MVLVDAILFTAPQHKVEGQREAVVAWRKWGQGVRLNLRKGAVSKLSSHVGGDEKIPDLKRAYRARLSEFGL